MLLELFFVFFAGCLLGILTGLIPGIHPNTAIIFVFPFALAVFGSEQVLLATFIVAMSITNAFVDFIPSVFLGAPEESTSLSVLPGHRLLLQGYGYYAIKLTVIGGLLSVMFITIMLPLIIMIFPLLFLVLRPIMGFVLVFVLVVIVFMEKKHLLAFIYVLLAGFLGILSTNLPVNPTVVLFPLLTGLFGIGLLVNQIRQKTEIPQQTEENLVISKAKLGKSSFYGTLAGILTGLLPGVGASQAAMFTPTEGDGFLVTVGAIATANILLSFLALWLVGNPRSGAAVALEPYLTLDLGIFLLIMAVAIAAAGVGALSTIKLSKSVLGILQRINYSYLSLAILVFLNIMIIYFSGPFGLLLAWTAAMLGLGVQLYGIRRTTLMSSLILPTALFYLGIEISITI